MTYMDDFFARAKTFSPELQTQLEALLSTWEKTHVEDNDLTPEQWAEVDRRLAIKDQTYISLDDVKKHFEKKRADRARRAQ